MTDYEAVYEAAYLVHIEGPDDIEEFETWDAACQYAHLVNAGIVRYTARSQSPGMVRSWAIPYLATDHAARWEKILPTQKPLASLAAAHTTDLREQSKHYAVKPMNSDDGRDE